MNLSARIAFDRCDRTANDQVSAERDHATVVPAGCDALAVKRFAVMGERHAATLRALVMIDVLGFDTAGRRLAQRHVMDS